jgi:hypothetical protein
LDILARLLLHMCIPQQKVQVMFRNAEDYARPRLEPDVQNVQDSATASRPPIRSAAAIGETTVSHRLMDQYLDRLALTAVQREWVMAQSTSASGQSPACAPFAALQRALADLSGGDELQTRLAMALPATRHVETRPDVWLRHHQAPKIHRASMASKPFLRTPQAALLACVHRRPAMRRSVPTGRLGWLAKMVVACGVVLMGSLAVPAFAHAGDPMAHLNDQRYETRAPHTSQATLLSKPSGLNACAGKTNRRFGVVLPKKRGMGACRATMF